MKNIDEAILDIDKNLCRNIEQIKERGFLSQNILSQLRNFVEYISVKLYCVDNNAEIELNYSNIQLGIKHVFRHSKYVFIREFHELLQISVSHYTLDEDNSERLMLKYYSYLLDIRNYLKRYLGFDVLSNLEDFPRYQDSQLTEYYEVISEAIDNPYTNFERVSYSDRYYIYKVKPFFVNDCKYYEVTYFAANDYSSKFDRMIAFTDKPILTNYATLLWIKKVKINIFGKIMPILIIDNWKVSIRPCEFNKMRDILKLDFPDIQTSYQEYKKLMEFVQKYRMNLLTIVELDDSLYKSVKKLILAESKQSRLFLILDTARELIQNNLDGSRVIRYLLFCMNNKVLKSQYVPEKYLEGGNPKLSNLRLDWKCVPFDRMPFDSSLKKHNPRLSNLLMCIPSEGREYELFARYIKNNSEIRGQLFTSVKEIDNFENIPELIQLYNSKLYHKHQHRRLCLEKGPVFIEGYKDDVVYIVKKMQSLTNSGVEGYSYSVQSWLEKKVEIIDDEIKIDCLVNMFAKSKVAMIYGAAGTGKSTLINYISDYFSDKNKLFLANTNTAVDNLRRKINIQNSEFSTVAKAKCRSLECDLLIVDESSTISNADFRKILDSINFELLIVVGDTYQIESIRFGNWFDVIQYYIKDSKYELSTTYRTNKKELLTVWNKIRNNEKDILEHLSKSNFSRALDANLFSSFNKDEIILCLNYGGLYGINNINAFMQAQNPSKSVIWGTAEYKVGDPILFIDTPRFFPLIYNNVKGVIHSIKVEDNFIVFDIVLQELVLTSFDLSSYPDVCLISSTPEGHSIIRFSVKKYRSTDYDSSDFDTIVPFQVAYASSIHKAQGLEYKSVKVIIANEIEENITHSIFYTAVTRAKEQLNIYWSPETEKRILDNIKKRDNSKDGNLIKIFLK